MARNSIPGTISQKEKEKIIFLVVLIHLLRELRAERALWKMWTLSTLANKSNNNNSHLHWCKSFVGQLYHCYSLFSVVRCDGCDVIQLYAVHCTYLSFNDRWLLFSYIINYCQVLSYRVKLFILLFLVQVTTIKWNDKFSIDFGNIIWNVKLIIWRYFWLNLIVPLNVLPDVNVLNNIVGTRIWYVCLRRYTYIILLALQCNEQNSSINYKYIYRTFTKRTIVKWQNSHEKWEMKKR